MNQEKIGKLIATLRKEKGYTQSQLADALHISDRTVSKWERGAGVPDVSLMLPLCKELQITVNELLAGEKMGEGNYLQGAEQNVMELLKRYKAKMFRIIVLMITVFYLAALCLAFVLSNRLVTGPYMLMGEDLIGMIEGEMQYATDYANLKLFRQNVPVYEQNFSYPLCIIVLDENENVVVETTTDKSSELYRLCLERALNAEPGYKGFIEYTITADSILYVSEFACGDRKYIVSLYSQINQLTETFQSEGFLLSIIVLSLGLVLFFVIFSIYNKIINKGVLKIQ